MQQASTTWKMYFIIVTPTMITLVELKVTIHVTYHATQFKFLNYSAKNDKRKKLGYIQFKQDTNKLKCLILTIIM